ncbi:MAG: hypothetical protein K6U03_01990 [Firmicutes bacterium]|nr:hypothetical protein [Bacillota bacterium]
MKYEAFVDDLREFIASRLERIDPFRESAEYARRHELAQGLYEELCALLPVDGQAKLREYADALGIAHCLETELFCERAFLDGVRLMVRALCIES